MPGLKCIRLSFLVLDTDCIAVGPLSDLGTSLRASMGPTKVLWFDRHLFVLYTLELVGWGWGGGVKVLCRHQLDLPMFNECGSRLQQWRLVIILLRATSCLGNSLDYLGISV